MTRGPSRWGRRLCLAALLTFVAVAATDAIWGEDVTLLMRLHDEDERVEARAHRDPRDDVAEIYGRIEPQGHLRVLVFDAARLIRPAEDPARRLLFVDRAAGERVIAMRIVWARAAIPMVALAFFGILLVFRARRATRG